MKRSLALFLMLTLVVSLLAGFGAVSAATTTAAAAALEVYTQTGDSGKPALIKAYSDAELAALKETKADGYGYVYYKGDAANAYAVTEYVTLDAVLADVGVAFAAGDKLAFICSDGPYKKGDFSYETMSQRGVDIDGNPVPTAIALTYGKGNLADGSIADIAKGAKAGSLQFVSGMTAAEKDGKTAAGNRMPSGVVSVTVVKAPALTISVKTGDYGKATVVKGYTLDDLAALKETKADGYGYVYYKGDAANAYAVTEFVTLDALLADAGASFAAGDKLAFTCSDGPYSKGNFSYETMSQRGVDADGNPVPTAIALTYGKGNLADGSIADIAKGAKAGSLQFVSGMTAAEKDGKNAAGNRMPSGVVDIAIVSTFTNPFTDVKEGDAAYDAVMWATQSGVTDGLTATTFGPDHFCNRGQVVTFLWRAKDEPATKQKEHPFADATADWYQTPILWAVENSITDGTSDTTFTPNRECKYSEIITFLYRALGEPGKTGTGAWYADAEAWAAANGITGAEYNRDAFCPRGDVVTYIYKALIAG